MGNPIVHNHGGVLLRARASSHALGTRNSYSAGSQDTSPRFAASYYLYGSLARVTPMPDIDRTHYFLCIGANPLVSNGSFMTAPDVRRRLRAIRERGGRIVVVDPRRTETAREADEWVPIRPGGDAALLLAMAQTAGRRRARGRRTASRAVARGWPQVARAARARSPRSASRRRPASRRRRSARLAREFADAPSSVAYTRVGVCNNRFGTLAHLGDRRAEPRRRPARRGRRRDVPDAGDRRRARLAHLAWATATGAGAAACAGSPRRSATCPPPRLAEEIETPGDGQVRALVVFAGNPVLSVPNGRRLDARARAGSTSWSSIDLYVNETTRHADVILPPAWTLAEDHFDLLCRDCRGAQRRALVARRWSRAAPDERADWEILLELAERLGGGPTRHRAGRPRCIRLARRLGLRWTPDADARPAAARSVRTATASCRGRKGLNLASGSRPRRTASTSGRSSPASRAACCHRDRRVRARARRRS